MSEDVCPYPHPSVDMLEVTSFGGGKGWNVTSAGWQVTLCDPIWHVSSSSGVATLVSELLYPCYFTEIVRFQWRPHVHGTAYQPTSEMHRPF